MNFKIISDSSSDLLALNGIDYASVPLKIITDEKEYTDDIALNVDEMIDDLQKYKGISQSSCPNVAEWQKALEGAEAAFCVTITSGLSGSCNAARIAVSEYLKEFPERKGYVIDTLSAGPEVALIIEKLKQLIEEGKEFEEIVTEIETYKNSTHLLFSLGSLRNLANNGRVNSAVAKITGILGIRIVGRASEAGVLEIIGKAKGGKKALLDIFNAMLRDGYFGGRVRIHHCNNKEAAESLSFMIKEHFPEASILIGTTRGLCSFYAEAGGLLIGYEA